MSPWILEASGDSLSFEGGNLCAPMPDTLHHERQIDRVEQIERQGAQVLHLEWLVTSHTVLLAFPRLEPIASTPWDRVLVRVDGGWRIAVRRLVNLAEGL